MKSFTIILASFALALTMPLMADVTVKLTDMHLCCGKCVGGVQKATTAVTGVKAEIDKEAGTTTLTAASAELIQKAVDAVVAAGYHAKVEGKTAVLDGTKAPKGNVKTLTLANVHNCCGACTKAIQGAVKGVAGVADSSLKAKETEFTITGDFEAAAVIAALEKAGFHATIK